MQADQKPVIITSIALAVMLLVGGILGFSSINSNMENRLDVMNQKISGLDINEQAIANAIVTGITIPDFEVPEYPDTEKLDRVCELTEGCEYWELKNLDRLYNQEYDLDIEEAEEDFYDALDSLLNIDEDFETLKDVSIQIKDEQIRVLGGNSLKEAKEDGNWNVKVFMRVRYTIDDEDVDDDDEYSEVKYLLVTSVLDEGEYDELSIEEVNRRFEF